MTAVTIWSLLTFAAYGLGVYCYRRSDYNLLCLPVLIGTTVIVGLLAVTGTSYPVYAHATKALRWLSGLSIIALAVPLYRQAALLRRTALPLLIALLVGCATAILGTMALAGALGARAEVILSLVPKSATMPIAMAAAERVGGVASLAAMAVVATGVVGALITGPILRRLRITDEAVHSFTLGLTAHAIGTARTLQTQPATVAFAALAMTLNGVATALAMGLLHRWI